MTKNVGISSRECDFRNQRGRFPPLKRLGLKELGEKSRVGRKHVGNAGNFGRDYFWREFGVLEGLGGCGVA